MKIPRLYDSWLGLILMMGLACLLAYGVLRMLGRNERTSRIEDLEMRCLELENQVQDLYIRKVEKHPTL